MTSQALMSANMQEQQTEAELNIGIPGQYHRGHTGVSIGLMREAWVRQQF